MTTFKTCIYNIAFWVFLFYDKDAFKIYLLEEGIDMLTDQQMTLIKKTAPLLKERGMELVTIFYENMISHHPELLNQFNKTNLMNGSQPQALAVTLYQAALHIDRLEELLPAVKLIAHKHVSTQVKAEQYPIVGYHLLLAMQELFGLAEDNETLLAWKDAYEIIANIFVTVESEMMKENEQRENSWSQFKPFIVMRKKQESPSLMSFYLKPADGTTLPSYSVGQYVTIQVDIPGEDFSCSRQYSLSDVFHSSHYRITVKRDGIVSTYLHDQVQTGCMLRLSMPQGMFCLDNQATEPDPTYFISAGSGITPMIGLVKTVAAKAQPFTMIHADHLADVTAFEEELTSVVKDAKTTGKVIFCNEQFESDDKNQEVIKVSSRINKKLLKEHISDKNGQFYLCGSPAFTKEIDQVLKSIGIRENRIHFEAFGGQTQIETEVVS
ncbi:FAD-binding oxidoreductase [Bacillus sp. NPDC077027]|uniref:FAD-binding oxidoreductase n=1 Tax=Bacillus sp. NPDC077027 TaxID=3390548 RepID=UPI003CFD8EE8